MSSKRCPKWDVEAKKLHTRHGNLKKNDGLTVVIEFCNERWHSGTRVVITEAFISTARPNCTYTTKTCITRKGKHWIDWLWQASVCVRLGTWPWTNLHKAYLHFFWPSLPIDRSFLPESIIFPTSSNPYHHIWSPNYLRLPIFCLGKSWW